MKNSILSLALLAVCGLTNLIAEEKAKTFKAGTFSFKHGAEWTAKAKPRAMSAGGLTYKIDDKSSLDADFYHFGKGQGGSVEANVQRWKKQFSGKPDKETQEKLADGKVVFVHIEGTYMDGPPFGQKTPKEGYAMLGAILPSDGGAVFVKLVGPKGEAAKALEAFKKLVTSAVK